MEPESAKSVANRAEETTDACSGTKEDAVSKDGGETEGVCMWLSKDEEKTGQKMTCIEHRESP